MLTAGNIAASIPDSWHLSGSLDGGAVVGIKAQEANTAASEGSEDARALAIVADIADSGYTLESLQDYLESNNFTVDESTINNKKGLYAVLAADETVAIVEVFESGGKAESLIVLTGSKDTMKSKEADVKAILASVKLE